MPMHPEEIIVSPLSYDATLTVCESDHKPIALALDLTVPGFDQELKRKLSFEALSRGVATSDPSVLQPPSIVVTREGQEMSSLLPGLGPVPLLRITGAATKILVTNTSHVPAAVVIGHYGDYSSERLKLPSWLDVTPCVFYLEGQGIKEVSIRASHTDTIYAQQYPLEAIIAVMAQNAVLGAGVGGWRNANDKSAILVIDAHPGS